ncbi:hypothetical protein HQ571_05880 [Candidatus Kuenenbacteria bacterium]|nr:hypothetical protein [Candidatus Kuenenbacteria bacterium]
MLHKVLQNFGLSEKETRVYLAALELGISTIQDLSKKSGVNRATTYIQVEALIKHGLINLIERGKKTLVVAEKPQRLLEILENKKNKVEKLEKRITSLLPDLEAIYNVKTDRPRVRFIDNKAGFEFFLDEMMKKKPENVYSIMPRLDAPNETFEKVTKKIGDYKIVFAMEKNTEDLYKKLKNISTKYFHLDDFQIEITMYSNRVLINKPILEARQSTAVLIEDKLFYHSFLALFNMFWATGQELE